MEYDSVQWILHGDVLYESRNVELTFFRISRHGSTQKHSYMTLDLNKLRSILNSRFSSLTRTLLLHRPGCTPHNTACSICLCLTLCLSVCVFVCLCVCVCACMSSAGARAMAPAQGGLARGVPVNHEDVQ